MAAKLVRTEAVIINDRDPQGAHRPAVFSSALGYAVALDLGNRQPKAQPSFPVPFGSAEPAAPRITRQGHAHGKAEPRSLADALRS